MTVTIPKPSAVHEPSRAERRTARQLLAGLRDGVPCPVLNGIATGPLARVVRFLAGCDLTFVFIGWDDVNRFYSYGSPTIESVTRLILGLLSESSAGRVTPNMSVTGIERLRSRWTQQAVEQIVDGLHDRELCFLLGWALAADSDVHLDHVHGAPPDKLDELLRSFLRDRLGTEVPQSLQHGYAVEPEHVHSR